VRAIRSARLMVLVFTESANNSTEIRKELALASQYRLAVIPARVENVLPSEALAYELATRQWVNLFENWEREVERLVAWIRGLLGGETPAPASANSTTAPAGAASPKPEQVHAKPAAADARSIKPVVAACLMIAMAVVNVVVDQALADLLNALRFALAGVLAVSAVLLFLKLRAARSIGLGAAGAGVVCYIALFVPAFELMRMGAVNPVVGFLPLVQAAVLAVVFLVLATWRPVRPCPPAAIG